MPHGPVALVSQSGSLGNFAFGPLIRDRKLGFSYFVSCGNQAGLTVEDYVEYFVDDPDVKVIAAIVEDLKNPQKLARVTAAARAQNKPMVFVQIGRSTAGRIMTQLAHWRARRQCRGDGGLPAPLRHCPGRPAMTSSLKPSRCLPACRRTLRAVATSSWFPEAAAARRSPPTISTPRV